MSTVLFVSDIHFGRGDEASERASEHALVSLLDTVRPDLEAVFLVGDVFEHYIEYRYLVPKGFVRFQARLAALTDAGVPVGYVFGNHDPWHIDHFERELGVRTNPDGLEAFHCGRNIYVRHGDGWDPSSRFYNLIKPLLRHAVPVWLYRTLLPADLGLRLARWYSRRFGSEDFDENLARNLRARAQHLLRTEDVDLVVLGHSHLREHRRWPEGEYLNPGCWYADRTVGVLDQNGARVVQWTGRSLEPIPQRGVDVLATAGETP